MKVILTAIVSLFLGLAAISSVSAQECDCSDVYEKAVKAYEENYSLFIYKVTDKNRDLYEAHKAVVRKKAAVSADISECQSALEEYIGFFRDGHTAVVSTTEKVFTSEKIEVAENNYKEKYLTENYALNPIFGIWESGSYTVAIVPEEGSADRYYVGVILESSNPNWVQNDVKFEIITNVGSPYKVNFMMGDHSINKTTGQLLDESIFELEGLNSWKKVWPAVGQKQEEGVVESKFKDFHLSYINDIPYLRLPDFYSVAPSFVDSMMQAHHDKLLQADFMIVDVRGNGGGSDGTYFPVLPYIFTGPVEIPTSGFWTSEYNIQILMDYKTGEPNKKVADYTAQEKADYEGMMAHKGTAYFEHEQNTFPYYADTIYSGPKKVIILTDNNTASSGETLVYKANQSERVVVYGQNTAGIVDGFNGVPMEIGCFTVVFPSSYRAKDILENPIDPYGIAPDVYVSKNEDVLDYAIKHMTELLELENNQ